MLSAWKLLGTPRAFMKWEGNSCCVNEFAPSGSLHYMAEYGVIFATRATWEALLAYNIAQAYAPGCHRTAPGWAHGEGEK